MSDQTPLDLEAIRARLDAATPAPWKDDGDVSGIVAASGERVTEGDNSGYGCVYISDADRALIAHAPTDLRRLLDENARLTAENERIRAMTKLHRESTARQRHNLEQKLIGWREAAEKAHAELDKVIREAAADKALIAEFATLQDRIPDTDNGDWGLGYDQGYNAALSDVRSMAAPEMPRPPAEEAQERPETPGTGSGRGTGVAEAQVSRQTIEENDR